MLDFGANDITVKLRQFDRDVEKSELQGEQVTVADRMDRILYESRPVEAAIVCLPARNEDIYANPGDEEGDPSMTRSFAPEMFLPGGAQDGDWLSFSGRATPVEGDGIMVDAGNSALRVDTSVLPGALASPRHFCATVCR